MSAPEILLLSDAMPAETLAALRDAFPMHGPFDPAAREKFLATHGARIAGIATVGKARLDAALLHQLPGLRIVACYSAGTDAIETDALAMRGIPLTTTSASLAEDVADLAIALMVMARRRLVVADRFVRNGSWQQGLFPLGQGVLGARLGLLGFGHIGQAVARRGVVMGMQPRYCTRRPVAGATFAHHATPLALAQDSDVLVVACPGGNATQDIVSAAVIDALGPEGTLVNVARGSVVDEPALIAALTEGRLGTAGLDVFADEPHVPTALTASDRVVLAPHIASATVATRLAMGRSMIDSLKRVLLTQVPAPTCRTG